MWEDWKFIFNAKDNQTYDYLVVFDDLHAPIKLNCPRKNTIHLATEPPSVLRYNENFISQFAWNVTQDNVSKHPCKILYQPGLTWFIGWQPSELDTSMTMDFRQLENLFDQPKTKLISVIASNKAFTPEHKSRLVFAQKLKQHFGNEIDFFGRGFVPMNDKLESLTEYRFQVVLENSSHNHYFSEKLTDCFISGTYPIYYGCPNLNEYFPKNSYQRIDINDFQGSITSINKVINQQFDQKYRDALLTARNQTLFEQNLFPMLIKIINKIEKNDYGEPSINTLHDERILPYGHEDFRKHFGPEERVSLRIKLSNLADKNILFRLLRIIYRFIKRRHD